MWTDSIIAAGAIGAVVWIDGEADDLLVVKLDVTSRQEAEAAAPWRPPVTRLGARPHPVETVLGWASARECPLNDLDRLRG